MNVVSQITPGETSGIHRQKDNFLYYVYIHTKFMKTVIFFFSIFITHFQYKFTALSDATLKKCKPPHLHQ